MSTTRASDGGELARTGAGINRPQTIRSKKRKPEEYETTSAKKAKPSPVEPQTIVPSVDTVGTPRKKKRKNARTEGSQSDPVDASNKTELSSVNGFQARLNLEAEPQQQDPLQRPIDSDEPSPFHSLRLSLYLPVYAISLSTGISSLLSTHLAPLLLTYFPPAQGIILAFTDPALSARPGPSPNLPLIPPQSNDHNNREALAVTADDFGVSWVWLTATFLVFRPEKDIDMMGYINVCSEGFVGLIIYNYFQAGVAKNRIPAAWKWHGPGGDMSNRRKKGRKGKIKDDQEHSDSMAWDGELETQAYPQEDEVADISGFFFSTADGRKIRNRLTFQVVDTEVIPAHDKEKWTLQIDGSLLDAEEEASFVQEERQKSEHIRNNQRERSRTTG